MTSAAQQAMALHDLPKIDIGICHSITLSSYLTMKLRLDPNFRSEIENKAAYLKFALST
jgi:hypothetical protein